MKAPRVALVTYAGEPLLTADDQRLRHALASLGADARPVNWDADEAWDSFDAIVIRSPWDYHKRYEEFTAWLGRLESMGASVWNPVPVLRWNSTKDYLRQLEAAGVVVPPTAWIARGERVSLEGLMRERGWETVVVKPTISATAFHTYRIGPAVSAAEQRQVDQLSTHRDVMIQPYLHEVTTAGELSLLFLDGAFSHAVLKRPRAGDFRVQSDFGGSVEPVVPPPQVVAEAGKVLEQIPGRTLYARVDGCIVGDHFMLMELEVVEPSLFLRYEPESAARLAAAILSNFPIKGRDDRHHQ